MAKVQARCRNGHDFTTGQRPGTAAHCPACRREGRSVSVWVSLTAPPAVTPPRPAARPQPVARPRVTPARSSPARTAQARPAAPARRPPSTEWKAPQAVPRRGCPVGYCTRCHVVHRPRTRPAKTEDPTLTAARNEIEWRCQALGWSPIAFATEADRLRWTPGQGLTFLRSLCQQNGITSQAAVSPRARNPSMSQSVTTIRTPNVTLRSRLARAMASR